MTASLFSKTATGGAVARVGFRYQDDYVLLRLPQLLSQGAFDCFVSENLGDVEVRYFRPGGGTRCIAYEAKNHELSLKEFWSEVETFKAMHEGSALEYVKFGLVCASFHKEVKPLISMLKTLRGRGTSLNGDSLYRAEAEAAIVSRVQQLGKSAELGTFILRRVTFEEHSDGAGQAAFNGLLGQRLPSLRDIRGTQQDAIRQKCIELVQESVHRPVLRAELERGICDGLGATAGEWLHTPTHCSTGEPVDLELEEYRLPTADPNGTGRAVVSQAQWRAAFDSAVEVAEHLRQSRPRNRATLSAEHRMSTACMLGHAFAATRGLRLTGEHRGVAYDFDDFTRSAGPFFVETHQPGTRHDEGVVAIAFSHGLSEQVGHAAKDLGLADLPMLVLTARGALASNADLTAAVEDAKAAVSKFKAQNGLICIHLFIKGPSFFAMGLGHRFNGLGPAWLYDWVDGRYVATVLVD
jgi:hypothetical protein